MSLHNILQCDSCRKELRECDKHEIIAQMSQIMGGAPGSLCKAEKIFETLKYDIAKYIVDHEYSVSCCVEDRLIFWLDEKSAPESAKKLSTIIEKYLK